MLKKSLIVILLALFIFQASYAQEVEVEVEAEAEAEAEVENEIGEAISEEEEAAGWQSLNVTQAFLDYRFRAMFDFGEQLVISQSIGYDIISNSSTWSLTKINFVNYTSVGATGNKNYAINALFEDAEGDSFTAEIVIEADFYLTSLKIKAVSYTRGNDDVEDAALETAEEALEVEDEAPAIVEAAPEGKPSENIFQNKSWSVVSNEEAQNDVTLKGYIDEGVQFALKKGSSDGVIHRSYTDWKQSSLQLVRKKVEDVTTYVFYVNLTDDEYQKANVAFFVIVNPDGSHFVGTSGVYYYEDFMPTS